MCNAAWFAVSRKKKMIDYHICVFIQGISGSFAPDPAAFRLSSRRENDMMRQELLRRPKKTPVTRGGAKAIRFSR
ncbi:hypothetical protein [Affinirhizobium pseudoryzae]|uniref:hypothetical protein n=1 Tax=Allorhizobium pseudoryzae TaxID=379684 RepID=UPI0013EC8CCB|nr:hypothetical protein [Allorhizobium pseudoryzae]